MERRLAAILAADVVGYSRLIRSDEEGTLAALTAVRTDVMNPLIAKHGGRIVKLMGDGTLVEFASVVDAVRAAVEIQRAVAERNRNVPEERRIAFRRDDNLHHPRVVLTALLIAGGRLEEAASALAEARRIRPQISLREVRGIVGGRYAKALQEIWDL